MRNILIFDIETDGLLDDLTKIHTLVIEDYYSGERSSYADQDGYLPIKEGIERLANGSILIGHNIIEFDLPAIKKVFPAFETKALIRDTIVMTRVIWADVLDKDFRVFEKRRKRGQEWIPKHLFGRHSLEAWGYRLGIHKGDYKGPWDTWSKTMQDYGEQDVAVTAKLTTRIVQELEKWGYSFDDFLNPEPEPGRDFIQLEHDTQDIISRQSRHGFLFDERKASALYSTLLQRRTDLEKELQISFKPWWCALELVTPKKDRSEKDKDATHTVTVRRFSTKTGKELKPYVGPPKIHYTTESPYTKVKLKKFSPSSRQDVANRLIALRGWEPTEFTKEGQPVVNHEVLADLPYPEANLLCEYYMIEKRIGALAEGKQAWLKQLKSDGRIHGRVTTNGAVTGRMTHSSPNMANVPSCSVPYGPECRELFTVPKGYKLVGCDADALELRCLAGYMATFDGGDYIKTVLDGNKDDGTDMHSKNARVLGCSRSVAKSWFYAFIYGAGDFKLGNILHSKGGKKEASAVGKRSRAKFLAALPALKKITDKVKAKSNNQGWIRGLDGRRISVRSEHGSFNSLLQSAGAIFMKRALVTLDKDLTCLKKFYEFVGNVHDEWQIEVEERKAETVGKAAARAIEKAGEYYDFKCPLAASYDIGNSWKETH